ncbi:N-acetylmuramoyl-L-alanine amidase domain [uncultured Caudovirales phage]|uniref:N-acetylmuramoyl-L-alanine amidase n=1 Tax=uncultured Caudovirales phage TaxID=2100421 RepID=A0A6J7WQU2_9CAUD|nr:N-acetylmuramoyl-L-alanine amidase domain [uncultured Caudovirales phage]
MPADLNNIPFVPARWYTNGRSSQVTMIVIHDMEAGEYSTTAESCANYFSNTSVQASAHYCADNDSVVCAVQPDDEAWHTGHGPTNHCSVGIEQAGYANQGADGWADDYSQSMIKGQVAPLAAALCQRYGIPVQFLNSDDLRAGNYSGITTHREITYAFVQGGHTDPGPDYPVDELISAIAAELGGTVSPSHPPYPAPISDVYTIGSTGSKVTQIQKLVGVDQDGVYGPNTASAVQSWQRNIQVPADGVWGPRTQEATDQFFTWLASNQHPTEPANGNSFLSALAGAMSQVLSSGSSGGAVMIAQNSLNAKGYTLTVDGVFGPQTDAAVRKFQQDRQLTADGIIGPQTWSALVS